MKERARDLSRIVLQVVSMRNGATVLPEAGTEFLRPSNYAAVPGMRFASGSFWGLEGCFDTNTQVTLVQLAGGSKFLGNCHVQNEPLSHAETR